MQFLEEEILEITEATWTSMFELDIRHTPGQPFSSKGEAVFIGQVNISGAWEGQVIIYGTSTLARIAASKIFAISMESVQEQDQIDAMYEISNIIAGNIKSLLPEPCKLSIPQVELETDSESEMEILGNNRVSAVEFESEGQPMSVTLWKRELSNA